VRRALPLALILAVLIGAIVWWRAPSSSDAGVAQPVPAPSVSEPSLPVDSVLRVKPSPSGGSESAPREAKPPGASPLIAQYRSRRDFASLYNTLLGMPPTPEALYLRAEIYRECARPAGLTMEDRPNVRASARAKFAAGLAHEGVASAQRLAAFDKLSEDACTGLDVGTFDGAELDRLLSAAADAGDPRAQSWRIAERIERSRFQGGTNDAAGYVMEAADFDEIRRLMATGDPGVILDLRDVLASSLQHGSVRLNGEPIDQATFHAALALVACEQGAACGADSQTVLANCAYRGRCAAASLYEYMYYYENSPADAQQIDAYRRAWQAMLNARDFSGLTLSPIDGIPGFSMTFGGRRGSRPGG